ncbi:MAG: SDR family oxidoreductase [Bacteroidales bacterium]|nr:SDR family oxidoreductase [Bacteroidales bacterium]
MNVDFTHKVVLITGSSRGIGRAAAELFAASEAVVAIHYNKNQALAEEALAHLKGKGHSLFRADISDPAGAEKLIREITGHYGRIDVLVNNAGVYEEYDILSLEYSEWLGAWDRIISTNLNAAANLSFLVAKYMKDRGGCRIVNVSSRGAFRGEPNAPAYGAGKAGMNSFGQSFAKAFAKHGIYVYTVAPGFVDTDMAAGCMTGEKGDEIKSQSPLNRIARPEEVARTIVFLASEGSEYLTGCIVDQNGASYLRT